MSLALTKLRMKKVFHPKPDSNPGPSNYKAAVLLTELHCQTKNYSQIGGLYTQYGILACIFSEYLRKSVLLLSQSCRCPSLVPVSSLTLVPRTTNNSKEGQISPKEVKIQKWQVSNLMLHRSVSHETEQSHMGRDSQSHMGQSSLILERSVLYGKEQGHIVENSLIWNRAVSYGTE